MTSYRSFACVAAFVFACWARDGAAASYCVGTSAQWQEALESAEVDGEDSLVMVRSGNYTASGDLVYHPVTEGIIPAGRLTVRGGYNSDCSSYSLEPGLTVIGGPGGREFKAYTETGSVVLAGLTFDGAFLTMRGDNFMGGRPEECPIPNLAFELLRVRIDGAGTYIDAPCQQVRVENTLVTDAVSHPFMQEDGPDVGLGVYLVEQEDMHEASLTVANSTMVNALTHVTALFDLDYIARAYFYNSVFLRSGTDIDSSANVLAVRNRYDTLQFMNGAGLLPGSGNNTSAAPQLDADYVPAAGSPMVNSGTANVPGGLPGTDHAGSDRVIGFGVDRGALESPVNNSGVYTVTNANASGSGSLRWAVELANADPGFHTIRFAIPGGCPKRITPGVALQIHEAISIDGWSQPGNARNTSESGWNGEPCIVLDGGATRGIGIEAMGALATNQESISVRGLAFENFDLAIALAFGLDHRVYGNQFGGNVPSNGAPAIALAGNDQAIGLIGQGRTVIGGMSASSRNLISDSSDVGVLITTFLGAGGVDNQVINNLIGVDRNGHDALPNGTGIRLNGAANRIIGNTIAGNTVDGILLAGEGASHNEIADNFIGGGVASFSLVDGNGRMGVMLQSGAHHNAIGPGNVIGRNGDDGVRVMDTAGGRNRIHGNRIGRNGALGIDLRSNGVSTNDPDPMICDPDIGCSGNRGQNFPLISSAILRPAGAVYPVDQPLRLRATLRSVLGGPYRIEAFASPSCEANGHGEGTRLLGSLDLSITSEPYCDGQICIHCVDGNCTQGFTMWVSEAGVATGDAVTMTATAPGGDTSEFSACRSIERGDDVIFRDGFEGN